MDGADRKAWFDAEHVENQERALDGDTEPESSNTDAVSERYATAFKWLDRLSYGERDDEPNERVVPAENVDEVDNEDSRDKIEADVRKIVEAYNMDTQRHGTERFAHELFYSIIHLLDRQSAITSHQWESYHNGMMREWMAKTEKLQAKVDELQELNEYHALQYELASEDADEKWNLYVAEHRRADINAADREMHREAASALIDSITEGLRKVDAILDGKDEGLA